MKVGIIGASFARSAYLPALRHVPDAEVVALASARMKSAQPKVSTPTPMQSDFLIFESCSIKWVKISTL